MKTRFLLLLLLPLCFAAPGENKEVDTKADHIGTNSHEETPSAHERGLNMFSGHTEDHHVHEFIDQPHHSPGTVIHAINTLKEELLAIEVVLAKLASSRLFITDFTEAEYKLLTLIVDATEYVEEQCSIEHGQCDLAKLEALIDESRSIYYAVQNTGKVSAGYLQTYAEEREKFEVVAEVAEEVQEKLAVKPTTKVVAGSVPTCTTVDGALCAFPFKYNGKGYRGCTLDGADGGGAWCSTKVDRNSNHVKGNFGNCFSGCPTDPGYFIESQDFGALGGSNISTRTSLYRSSTSLCAVSECWSTDGCRLVKNKLLTTFSELNKEFLVSFDFKATEYASGWQSVIHFTEDGDCCDNGQRIPAFFVENYGNLHATFSVNGDGNYWITTKASYPVDKWHRIQFNQSLESGSYMYRVKINGYNVFQKENNYPKQFSNVKVYAANNYYGLLKGSVRYLWVNTDSAEYCEDGCRLYEHCDYSGRVLHLSEGDYEPSLNSFNFNDKASSFSVTSRCVLNVWEHDNYKGRDGWIKGNIDCVEGSWNDFISSVECKCY